MWTPSKAKLITGLNPHINAPIPILKNRCFQWTQKKLWPSMASSVAGIVPGQSAAWKAMARKSINRWDPKCNCSWISTTKFFENSKHHGPEMISKRSPTKIWLQVVHNWFVFLHLTGSELFPFLGSSPAKHYQPSRACPLGHVTSRCRNPGPQALLQADQDLVSCFVIWAIGETISTICKRKVTEANKRKDFPVFRICWLVAVFVG